MKDNLIYIFYKVRQAVKGFPVNDMYKLRTIKFKNDNHSDLKKVGLDYEFFDPY